jgi:hypothetical protein
MDQSQNSYSILDGEVEPTPTQHDEHVRERASTVALRSTKIEAHSTPIAERSLPPPRAVRPMFAWELK